MQIYLKHYIKKKVTGLLMLYLSTGTGTESKLRLEVGTGVLKFRCITFTVPIIQNSLPYLHFGPKAKIFYYQMYSCNLYKCFTSNISANTSGHIFSTPWELSLDIRWERDKMNSCLILQHKFTIKMLLNSNSYSVLHTTELPLLPSTSQGHILNDSAFGSRKPTWLLSAGPTCSLTYSKCTQS